MGKAKATYKDLLAHNPAIERVISEKRLEFIWNQTDKTTEKLDPLWNKQLRKNARTLFRKHGLVHDGCAGIGFNKATICIGAGPSFKNNYSYLRLLNHWNSLFPFDRQPFIFVVSNHQFKPCLELGIIPHFVMLVDASDAAADHLLNIPDRGKNVPLVCCMHCNPRILKEWDKRGGLIQFFVTTDTDKQEVFESATGRKLKKRVILPGGNVVNVAWSVSRSVFDSTVFFAVGNDLSYPIAENDDDRRRGYYADGDYSANLKTGRDEAKHQFKWMGYRMERSLFTNEARTDLFPVATVPTLYGYKTWIETTVAIQDGFERPFHFYNCSEQGILGVMSRSEDVADLEKKDNWFLLDEVMPNRWHTRFLTDAAEEFLSARKLCQTSADERGSAIIQPARVSPLLTAGADSIVRSVRTRTERV